MPKIQLYVNVVNGVANTNYQCKSRKVKSRFQQITTLSGKEDWYPQLQRMQVTNWTGPNMTK